MKTNREIVRELFQNYTFKVVTHPAYCDDIAYSELCVVGWMKCQRFGEIALCETELRKEQVRNMSPEEIYKIHP